MSEAAELARISMLAWLLGGCGVVLLVLLGALMWQEMQKDRAKRKSDDDIPHWW